MTRDELLAIVKRNNADTLFACRMREALGLRPLRNRGQAVERDKSRKYRGAGKLMKQRYGVKL